MPARFKKNHCKDTGQSKRKNVQWNVKDINFIFFIRKCKKKKPTVQSMVEAWIQTLSSICKVGNFYISSSEHRLHYEMKDIPDIV